MAGSVGNIITDITREGLIFNMDAANRGSYVPNATLSHNTINPLVSGSLLGATFTPSTGSGVFSFDGADDYIDCGNDTSLNITGAFTISVWIIPDLSTSAGAFIVKRGSGGVNYLLLPYGAGVRFYIDSTQFAAASLSLTKNTLFNLVGVFRPGQSIDLYWNGSLNNSTSTSTTTLSTVTDPMAIGSNYNQSSFFNGVIGPVHIYNRALSSAEVLFNYNSLRSRFI